MKAFSSLPALGLLAGLSLAGGAAVAQNAQDKTWMSIGDLAAAVEAQGYTLVEVERDDGVYEVNMLDPQGYRIEAHLDPTTGERLQGPRWDD